MEQAVELLSNICRSKTNLDRCSLVRGGADKSLSRPGRKQVPVTKLGIYSTYSRRSSIHFLARCTNFCKPLKKKNQKFVRPTRPPRQQCDLRVGRKMANFKFFFSVQGTGGSPTGPDPENRVGDQDSGSPDRPVSSGLQVPGEPLATFPRPAFFLQNVLQLHQQR